MQNNPPQSINRVLKRMYMIRLSNANPFPFLKVLQSVHIKMAVSTFHYISDTISCSTKDNWVV